MHFQHLIFPKLPLHQYHAPCMLPLKFQLEMQGIQGNAYQHLIIYQPFLVLFLRSFCHIKNNASSAFSKSKKCNASFFSNFCFSLPPYTGISSRQMRYRLHPPASFLSRPSMERHSPLFRSANSDPADNLPLLY